MQIEFTVPGEPFGKQRPRHSRVSGTTYTPKETKLHEQLIQWAYRKAGGHKFPEDSEIRITIIAVMGIPKSTPKYRRADMLSGKICPTKKPDWDNIGKLVCDALNGVAYDDDKCVCDARVVKLYGEVPHLRVRLEDINAWDLRQPGTAGGEQ